MRRPSNIPTRFISLTLLLVFGVVADGQTRNSGAGSTLDSGSVIVRPRKLIIRRNAEVSRHAPNRKTAVIVLPVVSGIKDPAVRDRIRAAFDLKNIFDSSLDDYRQDTWLSDFGYKVNYNADHLLDITFTQDGLSAYPDTQHKHMLISLRDGNPVKAADVFDATKLDALAELVNRELQREIAKLKEENLADVREADERQGITDAYESLKFERQHLDEFSVSKTGITFLYDAGFPHVIKALEPQGRYFFSYRALNDFMRHDGPLAKFRN